MNKYIEFIKSNLYTFPTYELSADDKKIIQLGQLDKWITKKLLLKRFRKARVEESTRNDIIQKVAISIKENKPIYLIVCFGGYKHFWNPSHPDVDWAELFNLRFMSEFVSPILKAYSPGVILDYESEDVILPLIDNYPEDRLDSYAKSFKKLINIYSKNVPNNFRINYVRSQEQYNTEKLFLRIDEMLPAKWKEWNTLSDKEKSERLHRTPKCIMWNGKENWTKLSNSEKQQKLEESKLTNETYYEADFEFRGDYFVGGNHIPLVLSWGLCSENVDNWLTLGSTNSSLVDFWVGRGIFEDRGNKIVPRIVSQNQYKNIRNKLESYNFNVDMGMKNFINIEVYKGNLDYVQNNYN